MTMSSYVVFKILMFIAEMNSLAALSTSYTYPVLYFLFLFTFSNYFVRKFILLVQKV